MVTETLVSVIAFNRRKSIREYSKFFDEFCYKGEQSKGHVWWQEVICKMQYITAYLCTNEGDDTLEECC